MANIEPIRFQFTGGSTLNISVERTADGLFYDFTAKSFTNTGPPSGTQLVSIPEGSGTLAGRYSYNIDVSDATQWLAGIYAFNVHNATLANIVIGELGDRFTLAGATSFGSASPGLIVSVAEAQSDVVGFSAQTTQQQNDLVLAATSAINGACGRVLPLTAWDEYYWPEDTHRLYLRRYPIFKIVRVDGDPLEITTINNLSTSVQEAIVQQIYSGAYNAITTTGITLSSVSSAVSTSTNLLWGTYPTIQALVNQINTMSGWFASSASNSSANFSLWATTQIVPDITPHNAIVDGATLTVMSRPLTRYVVNNTTGEMTFRENFYTRFRYPDRTWAVSGIAGSVRVQYQAGFNTNPSNGPVTMPDSLKRAAFILIKGMMQKSQTGIMKSERAMDFSYDIGAAVSLIGSVEDLIKQYKRRRIKS